IVNDLFGQAPAQTLLQEGPRRADIRGKQIDVIQSPQAHAAVRKAGRLIFQRGPELRRRLIPLRLIINFYVMVIRADETVGGTVPDTVRLPAPSPSRLLDDFYTTVQRLWARGAKRKMTQTWFFSG